MFAPQLRHGLGVHQLEDALLPLRPLDVFGTGVLILQQRQQEFPQVDGVACRGDENKGTGAKNKLAAIDILELIWARAPLWLLQKVLLCHSHCYVTCVSLRRLGKGINYSGAASRLLSFALRFSAREVVKNSNGSRQPLEPPTP